MAIYTGKASDYAELQKESLVKQSGVMDWEKFLLNTQEGQSIQATADYDISQAYANYKQSEMNALQNTKLRSGFREKIASDLASSFEQQATQSRLNELSKLTQLSSAYDERLIKAGEQLSAIEKAAYEYGGVDLTKLGVGVDEGGLGHYTNTNGTMELTNYGRAYFDKIFSTPGFSEYLYEESPELYEYYASNVGDVREMVGGLDREDTSYDPDRYINRQDEYNRRVSVANERAGMSEGGEISGILDNFELVGKTDKKMTYTDAEGKSQTINVSNVPEVTSNMVFGKYLDKAKPGEVVRIKQGNDYVEFVKDKNGKVWMLHTGVNKDVKKSAIWEMIHSGLIYVPKQIGKAGYKAGYKAGKQIAKNIGSTGISSPSI